MTIREHRNPKVTDHYAPELGMLVDAMTQPNPDYRIRTHELQTCMLEIMKLRESYSDHEPKIPEWSFPHWRPKPTSSSASDAMRSEALGHKTPAGLISQLTQRLPLTTEMAIRACGGSRKQYRSMSEDFEERPNLVDVARLSLPRDSVFRAGMLEIMGAAPLPSRSSSTSSILTRSRPPLSNHRRNRSRGHSSGLDRDTPIRPSSSPNESSRSPAKPPCPRCSIGRTKSKKGKTRSRDDSLDFGCQGLKSVNLFCTCNEHQSGNFSLAYVEDSDTSGDSSPLTLPAVFREPHIIVQSVGRYGIINDSSQVQRPKSARISVACSSVYSQ
jgi:hypothetical protein